MPTVEKSSGCFRGVSTYTYTHTQTQTHKHKNTHTSFIAGTDGGTAANELVKHNSETCTKLIEVSRASSRALLLY